MATLLTEVCHNVYIEPGLQPVSNETLVGTSANCQDLQKGRDHSPPKAFLEEPSTWLHLEYPGIFSYINFSVPDVDHDDTQLYSFFFL